MEESRRIGYANNGDEKENIRYGIFNIDNLKLRTIEEDRRTGHANNINKKKY
jgi:hypothetical protein